MMDADNIDGPVCGVCKQHSDAALMLLGDDKWICIECRRDLQRMVQDFFDYIGFDPK
jgi:hypothetical protein